MTIKDHEKTLKSKYLLYDTYQADENDPVIKDCIDRLLKTFDGKPDKIKVRINMDFD